MANFQDGWLLLHTPDSRQKPGSLKQRPCRVFSQPADVLSQQVQGWLRTGYTTVVGNHSIFIQTHHPQIRRRKLFRDCKHPSSGEETRVPAWQRVFFSVCLLHTCVLTPSKCLSSAAADSVCYLLPLRFSLSFNSLTPSLYH